MALEMVRIDDRLIHGQVIVGWCPNIKPDRLILCDDEVAESDWEREIYLDAGCDYNTCIWTVKQTARELRNEDLVKEKIFLIVNAPKIVLELVNLGVTIKKVTVGGMHFQTGKRKILDFVYIDDRDLESFHALVQQGIKLEARDVPGCRTFDLTRRLDISA